MAEEYEGIGDKGLEDTTIIDVRTLMGALLKDLRTSDHFPQLPKYQDFLSISIQVKEIVV